MVFHCQKSNVLTNRPHAYTLRHIEPKIVHCPHSWLPGAQSSLFVDDRFQNPLRCRVKANLPFTLQGYSHVTHYFKTVILIISILYIYHYRHLMLRYTMLFKRNNRMHDYFLHVPHITRTFNKKGFSPLWTYFGVGLKCFILDHFKSIIDVYISFLSSKSSLATSSYSSDIKGLIRD